MVRQVLTGDLVCRALRVHLALLVFPVCLAKWAERVSAVTADKRVPRVLAVLPVLLACLDRLVNPDLWVILALTVDLAHAVSPA